MEMPPTEAQVDVAVHGNPVSIKTITGKSFRGVKLIWTVDAEKAAEFRRDYCPRCDIVLAQICWNSMGGLYFLPAAAQQRTLRALGSESYMVLPKSGTNPRGVEISNEALKSVLSDQDCRFVEIYWNRCELDYDPYRRWLDYWRED